MTDIGLFCPIVIILPLNPWENIQDNSIYKLDCTHMGIINECKCQALSVPLKFEMDFSYDRLTSGNNGGNDPKSNLIVIIRRFEAFR